MPRLIFKCPYIKGGTSSATAHLENYVKYMATRNGVERIDPGRSEWPATSKQKKMVEQILRDFPLSRGMFEYEDYAAEPTRTNASEFITRALEDNYNQIAKKDNYLKYIATRPRAQRVGSHGLFTGEEDQLVLAQVAEAVAAHPGNVWLPIISLRREDAARLGYDKAEEWKALLSKYAMEMAEAMKIPWEDFRWYAAFHDEAHHPHIHMVCYSADPSKGFLTTQGIAQIKSGLAKEIFRQELTELYQKQTQSTASRRVNGTFYLLGEEMTLEQFCEEHDLAYPQDNREFVLRPASLDEVGLFYSEEKLDEALGTVGHLRMDFGHGEKEFWHTWWPHNEDRFNTPEFKEVLQRFVDDLRQTGLLKNLGAMDAYCWQHGGSITEDRRSYGYIAETENYRFCLRCTPFPGEYQGYLYGQLTTYTFHAILNASLSNCRSGIFKPFPKSSGGHT